jgi:hypothetical protein
MQRDGNPSWSRLKRGPFHRIGDSYGRFFNPDHFMGRSAFDGPLAHAHNTREFQKIKEKRKVVLMKVIALFDYNHSPFSELA